MGDIGIMILDVNYNNPFKDLTKIQHEDIELEEGARLIDLIEKLAEKYGDEFKELIFDEREPDGLVDNLTLIINGNSYRGDNFLERELHEKDKIWFAYTFYGG